MSAPAAAIIASRERLARTFPHEANAQARFTDNQAITGPSAFRNNMLQAANLMLVLRAQGLDRADVRL